ncbi:MAG: DUF5674 family protein [Candidatus Liptonbacteria bacterium]|nr:DUF5674 family protein [Candidatus Liptonbacteria bacterium]
MNIKIITAKISRAEAKEIAKEFYGDMVKGVVDIERELIAPGGEYHMDANMVLVNSGSEQKNVWGEEANAWSFRKTFSRFLQAKRSKKPKRCTEPVRFQFLS